MPIVIHVAKVYFVNYSVPVGTVLELLSFFNRSSAAVLNITVSSAQPIVSNFAVQQTGPDSGEAAAKRAVRGESAVWCDCCFENWDSTQY